MTSLLWQMPDSTAPPERHADRVIAAPLRELVKQRTAVAREVTKAIACSNDGNPKAQARMANRIRKADAIQVDLQPGKRGRYKPIVLVPVFATRPGA